jgi:hypothetical protein
VSASCVCVRLRVLFQKNLRTFFDHISKISSNGGDGGCYAVYIIPEINFVFSLCVIPKFLMDRGMPPFRCHYGSSEYAAGDLVSLIIQSDIESETEFLVYAQVLHGTIEFLPSSDLLLCRHLVISLLIPSGLQKLLISLRCL